MSEAAAAAELRAALAEVGLSRTYQTDGDRMSVLSVWTNLTVWCAGDAYFWRDGPDFRDFAYHPIGDPAGAAVKVKAKFEELRDRPDLFKPDLKPA